MVDEFIDKLKCKDYSALEFIIDKYSNLVFKVAYSVVNNKESAEECINDVFMKVWINAENFQGDEVKFKNWMCTIAKYTAIDKLRKEKRHMSNVEIKDEVINNGEDIEEKICNLDKIKLIKSEINAMKKIDREIFVRRFYYSEKITDIARCLDMSENAVTLRILRGRKALFNCIEGREKNEK